MLLHYLNRADRKQGTHCHNVIAKVGSIYGLGAASFPPLIRKSFRGEYVDEPASARSGLADLQWRARVNATGL